MGIGEVLRRWMGGGEKAAGGEDSAMNNLIVGLGNVGDAYALTRHNAGFMIVDALAAGVGAEFRDRRYGFVGEMRIKNQRLFLLKPSTLMNLSGNAVRYWVNKEKIEDERLLVVCDDLALPFGTLRMKPGGSEGGHNGLRHITSCLGTNRYARLRFGIGHNFERGAQVDYVLTPFTEEERARMGERIGVACKMIETFCLEGVDSAMNKYNGR